MQKTRYSDPCRDVTSAVLFILNVGAFYFLVNVVMVDGASDNIGEPSITRKSLIDLRNIKEDLNNLNAMWLLSPFGILCSTSFERT